MKNLTVLLCLGAFALTSCEEKPEPLNDAKAEAKAKQEEVERLRAIAEEEAKARRAAETQRLSSASRAETLEKAVLMTGVAAVAFLFLGGAMGSKARKDVLES